MNTDELATVGTNGIKLVKDLGMFPSGTKGKRKRKGLFLCTCGNTWEQTISEVRQDRIKSCGCSKLLVKPKHGMSNTRLYRIWKGMKCRVAGTATNSKTWYKDHNIRMYLEWSRDFMAFHDWAIANGYNDTLSIDRKEVNKGYYPTNCRWATNKVQSQNQRMMKTNTSGYVGVSYNKKASKYSSMVSDVNGKQKCLGYFSTAKEAAIVRDNFYIQNNQHDVPLNFKHLLKNTSKFSSIVK